MLRLSIESTASKKKGTLLADLEISMVEGDVEIHDHLENAIFRIGEERIYGQATNPDTIELPDQRLLFSFEEEKPFAFEELLRKVDGQLTRQEEEELLKLDLSALILNPLPEEIKNEITGESRVKKIHPILSAFIASCLVLIVMILSFSVSLHQKVQEEETNAALGVNDLRAFVASQGRQSESPLFPLDDQAIASLTQMAQKRGSSWTRINRDGSILGTHYQLGAIQGQEPHELLIWAWPEQKKRSWIGRGEILFAVGPQGAIQKSRDYHWWQEAVLPAQRWRHLDMSALRPHVLEAAPFLVKNKKLEWAENAAPSSAHPRSSWPDPHHLERSLIAELALYVQAEQVMTYLSHLPSYQEGELLHRKEQVKRLAKITEAASHLEKQAATLFATWSNNPHGEEGEGQLALSLLRMAIQYRNLAQTEEERQRNQAGLATNKADD